MPRNPGVPYFVRSAQQRLAAALRHYPVAVLCGARQVGKSTLLRHALPDWAMVSLEDPDVREFASADPRGFLSRHPAPLVIDEAQRVPQLLSYLQTAVDASAMPGQYVLSGSQQFSLLAGVTQSLAGRASMVELFALRLKELADARAMPPTLDGLLLAGCYPAVHARRLRDDPHAVSRYHADYMQSYLERDVRSLSAVQDLATFQRFMRLAAARTGQLLNLNALANDCGIAQPTAAAWINLLEASYVVKRIAPYHRNFGKRLVKTPKLYFLDTGLCAWLLGITSESALSTHYARGALFETWVVTEALKWQSIHGTGQPLYFWRDNIGNEVDLLLDAEERPTLVEIKSGQTFQPEWLRSLATVDRHLGGGTRQALVYGGANAYGFQGIDVIGWRGLVQAG
ncbi:MAG TPA: ATP-binding protein [Rubrivivax sp.]|nr:ATP-binding protein [Rubrivivax sp.]